jgi:hypothetical protein
MTIVTGANYALARRYWLRRALEARRWLRRQCDVPPIFALRDVQAIMVAIRRSRASWGFNDD